MSGIEDRIKKLEIFQSRWKWYFWLTVVTAGLFGIFFHFDIRSYRGSVDTTQSNFNKSIETIQIQQETLRENIQNLQRSADDASSTAKNALLLAGDVEDYVLQIRNIQVEVKALAHEIQKLNETTVEASTDAKKANQSAQTALENIKKEVDGLKLMVADFNADLEAFRSDLDPNALDLSSLNPSKDLDYVQIHFADGSFSFPSWVEIRIKEGDPPSDYIEFQSHNIKADIFIPEGKNLRITGKVSFAEFIVTEGLSNRVINELEIAFSTRWRFDTKTKKHKFRSEKKILGLF